MRKEENGEGLLRDERVEIQNGSNDGGKKLNRMVGIWGGKNKIAGICENGLMLPVRG